MISTVGCLVPVGVGVNVPVMRWVALAVVVAVMVTGGAVIVAVAVAVPPLAVGVGVAIPAVNVAQFPAPGVPGPRHNARGTIPQSSGHVPAAGGAQRGPVHWQQSFGPGVLVGEGVG